MSLPESVEFVTGEAPVGSVIWLHGLGADGHDFEPIVPELRLPESLPLRFVFPHAPVQPVTINGGMSMRAWYDVVSLDAGGAVDEAGIRASCAMLERLIERENERGIDTSRIVIAGFSQGGAIALHTALRWPERLAGLIALSTFLPMTAALKAEGIDRPAPANRQLPIFMAHGHFDPLLPRQLGRSAADRLESAGFRVEWHDYQMAHAVCAEEIDDISAWLQIVFADPK